MPITTVKLRPGINVELTPLLNEAGYSASQLGRFKSGLFQKLGGWTSSTVYHDVLPGVPKDLHAWQDLNENKYLLAGTTTTLTIIENNNSDNKTPQTLTTNTAAISSAIGSALVRIDDATVSEITGDDTIFFNTPVAISDIILFGFYKVNAYLAAGAFNINAGKLAAATSSTETVPVFDTIALSATVTVTLANHGLAVGDEVDFPIPTIGSTATVTISNASPGVVSWATHGLVANDSIEFTTTGALPAPLAVGTTYYVKTVLTDGTFTISGSAGGAVINTTDAGSGAHTAYLNANVTISGTYSVTAVDSPSAFKIIINSQASVTTTFSINVGLCQLKYYLTIGPQPPGVGYGIGTYGSGTFGTGVVVAAQVGTPITAEDWSVDNFGKLGIACPKNGGIYYYDPNGGFVTAQLIPNAPLFNGGVFVAMPQQQIVAWGSSSSITLGYVQDALLVRYCDVGNLTTWTGTDTNQAGSYRLSSGSLIVGGRQGPQQGLLWTDLDLWAMSYIGGLLVYGFNKVGSNCGLIAQHAHAVLGSDVFWMGQTNFYTYGGQGVQVLPCTVWDFVFQNINTTYKHKCIAASNTPFNEIWFFFPSAASTGENDSYVKYNTTEQSWDFGALGRSAWTDQSVFGNPIGATATGNLYQHEVTNNANGIQFASTMRTAYWMLSEGEELIFVDWLLPDFKWGLYGGTEATELHITIYATDYPGNTPQAFGPYTVTKASPYINVRIRARYMAIEVTSDDLDSFWRLGAVKYRWATDGRR